MIIYMTIVSTWSIWSRKIIYVRKKCIGRESNPGLPRGRREFYHRTTNASWKVETFFVYFLLMMCLCVYHSLNRTKNRIHQCSVGGQAHHHWGRLPQKCHLNTNVLLFPHQVWACSGSTRLDMWSNWKTLTALCVQAPKLARKWATNEAAPHILE